MLNELLETAPIDNTCYKNVEDILNFIIVSSDDDAIINNNKIYNELNLTETNIEQSLHSCSAKMYFYSYKETVCNSYLELLDMFLDTRESVFMENLRAENPKNAFKEKEADIKRALMMDWEYKLYKVLYTSVKIIKSYYSPIVRAYDAQSRLLMAVNKRDMFKGEGGMN